MDYEVQREIVDIIHEHIEHLEEMDRLQIINILRETIEELDSFPDLVYDFRIKSDEKFVDISTLSLEELTELSHQYSIYRSYHQMIIERINVLTSQGIKC